MNVEFDRINDSKYELDESLALSLVSTYYGVEEALGENRELVLAGNSSTSTIVIDPKRLAVDYVSSE
ncbi:24642_t:CDS:2, partial [Cetraspora pellucida]